MDINSDILLQFFRQEPGAFAPVPSEERSLSDRLRPPYISLLQGASPINAEASRNLELAIQKLPEEYRKALLQAPARNVDVGVIPMYHHDVIRGINQRQGNPPMSGAIAPWAMSHELIHELGRRWGMSWSRELEEELARVAAGPHNEPPQFPESREEAEQVDALIRGEYGPGLGLVQMLQRMLRGIPRSR